GRLLHAGDVPVQHAGGDIQGGRFAERCQGFLLIGLGGAIVVIGATLTGLLVQPGGIPGAKIAAFIISFAGSAGLWWIYFDRSAEESEQVIAESADPGRLGRSAYHLIHPVMVAGIIVDAAAEEILLSDPTAPAASLGWLLLGGTALYIAGHAAFKAVVWRTASWPRIAALAVLALLGALAPHVSALVLALCTGAVVVGVCLADYVWRPSAEASPPEIIGS